MKWLRTFPVNAKGTEENISEGVSMAQVKLLQRIDINYIKEYTLNINKNWYVALIYDYIINFLGVK